jgi:Mitochondrial 28S ribosomal protein S22
MLISRFLYLFADKDPSKSFFNPENQKLLKSITRLQLDKVFRKRAVEHNDVEYKLAEKKNNFFLFKFLTFTIFKIHDGKTTRSRGEK